MSSDTNTKQIMRSIEKKTEEKVMKTDQTKDLGTSMIKIIKEGGKEFEQKVGRPMTYSEMREMFG